MTFKGISYRDFLGLFVAPFVFFPSLRDDEETPRGRKIYLRHDIDMDPRKAAEMAKIEKDLNIRSTYFILDTAEYFKRDISGEIETIKSCGHEIGWHNDAFQQWMKEGQSKPIRHYIETPLRELRKRYGCNVRGTSAHFVAHENEHLYHNYNIWSINYKYQNLIPVEKFNLLDFNLEYETYKVNRNIYLCDSGNNWNIDPYEAALMFKSFTNCTIQILIHPQWWTP
jgi:hypothetical protein